MQDFKKRRGTNKIEIPGSCLYLYRHSEVLLLRISAALLFIYSVIPKCLARHRVRRSLICLLFILK